MAGRSGKTSRRNRARGIDLSALLPYLVPGVVIIGVFPVSLITHWVWGADTLMSALVGGVSVLLTGATHVLWGRRHRHTRMAATWFAGCVLGWLTVATATGPTTRFALNSWGLGGAALWIVWMIRHAAYSAPHDADVKDAKTDPLFGKIQSLLGGRSVKVTEKNGRVEAEVQLDGASGMTAADVQNQKEQIASALKIGKGQVTVSEVADRADRAVLAFTETENLRETVAWSGTSAPGKSVADAPLRLGMRADGDPLELWIVGDEDPVSPRQLPHTLVTGVNGSGKTSTWKTAIVEMRSRTDVVPIVAGPEGKINQDFAPIQDALGMFVVGRMDVLQFMSNLPHAVGYRQTLFSTLTRRDGTTGYSQWEPDVYKIHGVPLLSVDIEEITDFLDDAGDDFDEAIRKARSAGISITGSLQTAIHTNIQRKTRGQFTNSLCHGCVEDQDAKFSLSPGTREAGADPTKWRNNYVGSLYGETVGTAPETWATEARAFYLDRARMRAELDASRDAGYWAQIDPGTLAYLTRGLSTNDVTNEQIESMLPPVPEDSDTTRDDSDPWVNEEGVDVSQPIPAPVDGHLFRLPNPYAGAGDNVSVEQFRQRIADKIDELESSGVLVVNATDVAKIGLECGRARSTLYDELNRLCTTGRLTKDNGKPPYRINVRMRNGAGV